MARRAPSELGAAEADAIGAEDRPPAVGGGGDGVAFQPLFDAELPVGLWEAETDVERVVDPHPICRVRAPFWEVICMRLHRRDLGAHRDAGVPQRARRFET